MTRLSLGLCLLTSIALVGCSKSDPEAKPAEAAQVEEHAGHAEHADHANHGGDQAEHAGHRMPAGEPVPGTSIFQLGSSFIDETGATLPLASLRGKPTVVVMFYGSCQTLCPVLVNDTKTIDSALSQAEREGLQVVLVTLDPERDTGERLIALADEYELPRPRWKLLRASSDADLRELAMVLGVQFRKLDDGEFAHSALITLLDPEGTIDMQIEGLQQPNEAMIARIRELSAKP